MAKVCKKMHKHVFDDGENINLRQVMKDVYENFTLVFKATISEHEKFESQAISHLRPEFIELRKELGFLVTFFRCTLNRCVDEGTGVIKRSLVGILTDIESHFVDLFKQCSTLLSGGRISIADDQNTLSMGRFEHLVSEVSNAYLVVFSTTDSSPSSTSFMQRDEFLDQLLEDLYQCDMEDKFIKTSIEVLELLRNYLHQFTKENQLSDDEGLSKELWVCLEVVTERVACYSFLNKYGNLPTKNLADLEMSTAVIQAFVLMKSRDSTDGPSLTDGLLKFYVDCVQQALTKLISDDMAIDLLMPQVRNQIDVLHQELERLLSLVLDCPQKNETEELADIRRRFQALVENVGSLVILFFKEETTEAEKTTLRVSDFLEQARLLKDRLMNIVLLGGRKKERELQGRPVELPEVCKKMHKHVFDCENIDLNQVMKDMCENFTLIFKATVSQYENLESNVSIWYDREFLELKKALGFLITFSRCMFKRCVEEGTTGVVIDTSLVDILTDIESHFLDLFEHCSRLLSRGRISPSSEQEFLEMGSFKHMVSRVSNAFLTVLSSTDLPPSSVGFVHSDESMFEFLDQLLENLYECEMKDKNIKTSIEVLGFLRNYLQFTNEYWMSGEGLQEFLMCVEVVAESAACYSFMTKHGTFSSREQYLQIKKCSRSKMSVGVLRALVLKVPDSTDLPPLTNELLRGYVDCIKEYQFGDLDKELEFLVGFVVSYTSKTEAEQEKLSDIRAQFQALVRNVGIVILSSLKEEETTLDMATKISTRADLLQQVHLLKECIIDTFGLLTLDKIGQSSPETNQLGFLNSLVSNTEELKEYLTSVGFQSIHEDLVLLRLFLQNMKMGNNNMEDDDNDGSKVLLRYRIKCAAYAAEYLINSYLVGSIPDWCRSSWLSDFEQLMVLVKETFEDVTERRSAIDINKIDINVTSSTKNRSRVSLLPTSTDVVIGFEDEMRSVKERLISDSRKLDVVSIFGMGGLGKTTFAKRVYEDPSIVDHFPLRAWCCVSQEYNKSELLLEILDSITKLTSIDRTRSDGELAAMLSRQLMGRRYLIVMDDIWEKDAFQDLKHFFPDSSNGSRIMLTSRKRLEDYRSPLELRLLTRKESWDLLEQKVCVSNEGVPLDLCEVGMEIAEKCKGLPLAIVVVAGILAKSERRLDFWNQVARHLSSYIVGDATSHGQVTTVLELSYEHLPDHLKPLFLYLGGFPEDREIPADKVMWLWIAEGFFHKTNDYQVSISLEVQAEQNLMELIDRSLVMIAERRSDGRIKSCRVHDMLRDLCLRKAKEENFMRQTTVCNYSPDPITYERRISISLNRSYGNGPFVICEGFRMLSFPPPLSSFLFYSVKRILSPSEKESMKSVFQGFRLLRILHSESIIVDEDLFRDHIVMLVLLRYISIRTNWNVIPSSISNLRNLETLIIKGLRGEIVVPGEILNLVRLRHLHVNDRADFNTALSESSSKLKNLETLSTPAVCCEEEKKLIQRVPNLRKFRCILVEKKGGSTKNYYQLPQLESLNQLESLKMLCYGRLPHSGKFNLPSTLKQLSLSKFRLNWSEISSFQKLPNLEVLKLRGGAVEGALWDTGDGEFPKLKFLKLEALNIKQWTVSAENFPCLKTLVLKSCKQLEEIPSSVGDFYSLEKIEVVWCSTSAVNWANDIQEEQRDAGNEVLKVQIYTSS